MVMGEVSDSSAGPTITAFLMEEEKSSIYAAFPFLRTKKVQYTA